MVTPKKEQIRKTAFRLDMEDAFKHGLPFITPTGHELKESGTYARARDDLMSSRAKYRSQQTRYVHDIAKEVGLTVVERKEFREQQRKVQAFEQFRSKHPTQVKRVNGYRIILPVIPTRPQIRKPRVRKPKKVVHIAKKTVRVPQKKKRKKSHTSRSSKTMRGIRHITNVKVFSFPDNIWKVRRKKRKR